MRALLREAVAGAPRHAGQGAVAEGARSGAATVLLLGNYRPTIAVARALDGHGCRVMVGAGGGEGGADVSRHASQVWHHPELEAGEATFRSALADLLRARPDIRFLFPISEEFVAWVARNAGAVPAGCTVVSPTPRIVTTCLDKPRMLALARTNGVACLPFAVVTRGGDLRAAAGRLGWPVVVRPLPPGGRLGSRKAVIAATSAELEQALPRWPMDQVAMLVQRRAMGGRRNVFFAAHEGEIFTALETKILRTDRADGTGLAVDGVTVPLTPVLLDDCRRLARAMTYTGVGLAQFIVDDGTGQRCFLELNPRIAGSHAVTEAAGQDLSHIALKLAAGWAPSPGERSFVAPPGLRYAWTYGDLRGLKAAVREGDVGPADAARWLLRAMHTLLRANAHMTWRWSDPLPTLILVLRLVPGLRRLAAALPLAIGRNRRR